MSYEAIAAVIKCSHSTSGSRTLLMVLAHHADRFGRNAYPSIRTLAEEARLDERHVSRCLRALEELGEIICSIKAGPGQANVYSITLLDKVGSETVMTSTPSPGDVRPDEGGDISDTGGDISCGGVMTPRAPKHTVNHPEDLSGDGEEARAREKSFAPITKSYSARRPRRANPPVQGWEPDAAIEESAPEPPERLADIESLRADPVLLALAEAAAALMKQPLHTLSAAQAEALGDYRRRWNGHITAQVIGDVKRKIELRGQDIEVPAAYLVSALDNIAARPRAAPATAGHGGPDRGRPASSPALDVSKYTDPNGKWYHLFNSGGER